MTLSSTPDLFYFVAAIALAWVAVFLSWALYELAMFVRQSNKILTDTRQKITRLEQSASRIKERLESSVSYLGVLAEGGKTLMSFLRRRDDRREHKSKKG